MRIFADCTELYIAVIALFFAVLFHVFIMRRQSWSVFARFCWDVLIFLICLVGISVIYYSALALLASGG